MSKKIKKAIVCAESQEHFATITETEKSVKVKWDDPGFVDAPRMKTSLKGRYSYKSQSLGSTVKFTKSVTRAIVYRDISRFAEGVLALHEDYTNIAAINFVRRKSGANKICAHRFNAKNKCGVTGVSIYRDKNGKANGYVSTRSFGEKLRKRSYFPFSKYGVLGAFIKASATRISALVVNAEFQRSAPESSTYSVK